MKITFKRLIVAFSVGFSMLSSQVFAEVYNFTGFLTNIYNNDNNTPALPLSGNFDINFITASGDVVDVNGADVIGISGTFLGLSITGLSSTFSSPDNKLFSTSDYFSSAGVSFLVDPALGQYNTNFPINAINFLFLSGAVYADVGCASCNNIVGEYSTGNLSISTYVSQVPEPKTYAMFMAGLCMFGFVSRRKKIS